MKKSTSSSQRLSNDMVMTTTGKTWEEWLTILDNANGKKMTHTEVARYLYVHYLENNGWWCQLLASRYIRDRMKKKRI